MVVLTFIKCNNPDSVERLVYQGEYTEVWIDRISPSLNSSLSPSDKIAIEFNYKIQPEIETLDSIFEFYWAFRPDSISDTNTDNSYNIIYYVSVDSISVDCGSTKEWEGKLEYEIDVQKLIDNKVKLDTFFFSFYFITSLVSKNPELPISFMIGRLMPDLTYIKV